MNMKRIRKKIFPALVLLAMMLGYAIPALATDTSMSFDFQLTCDGGSEKYVQPGDVITVNFTLARTDSTEDYTLYTMQDEISYDDEFFELVEGSVMTKSGIATTDIGLLDGYRSFYMNRVSMGGGEPWKAETLVGNFQLRVIGTSGTSIIENRNCIVGNKAGTESYTTTAKNLTVIVSADCTVRFETYQGTDIPDQTVRLGEKITRPEDPVLDGYRLDNWYKDWYETEVWDFENDVVEGNMTLFAGWTANTEEDSGADTPEKTADTEAGPAGQDEKTGLSSWALPAGIGAAVLIAALLLLFANRVEVLFTDPDGTVIRKARVRKGAAVRRPVAPAAAGKTFEGWFADAGMTQPWDFSRPVNEKTTIYAGWKKD